MHAEPCELHLIGHDRFTFIDSTLRSRNKSSPGSQRKNHRFFARTRVRSGRALASLRALEGSSRRARLDRLTTTGGWRGGGDVACMVVPSSRTSGIVAAEDGVSMKKLYQSKKKRASQKKMAEILQNVVAASVTINHAARFSAPLRSANFLSRSAILRSAPLRSAPLPSSLYTQQLCSKPEAPAARNLYATRDNAVN